MYRLLAAVLIVLACAAPAAQAEKTPPNIVFMWWPAGERATSWDRKINMLSPSHFRATLHNRHCERSAATSSGVTAPSIKTESI